MILELVYTDYVPSYSSELQERLKYEVEPHATVVDEEATEIITIEEKTETTPCEGLVREVTDFEEDSDEYEYEFKEYECWHPKRHNLMTNREPHHFSRMKKKYKKPKVNPDRWVSARQLRRDAKKGSKLDVATSWTPYYCPPPETTYARYEPPRATPPIVQDEETDIQVAIQRSVTETAPCGLSYQQIQELMNRELTAEDYLLLLELDASVAPKTLSASVVESYPIKVIEEDDCCLHESCPVCMSPYEAGEIMKTIPICGHSFHEDCINHWLLERSTTCPLDNISLLT
jgi:hypothetical protein